MRPRSIAKGIYALWYRELKVFLRERSRVVSAIFMPLFWYVVFGGGVSAIAQVGVDYRYFIFPGFLAMTVIFSALFNGAYVVWDKRIDFLKEVLITPLSRTIIFVGKVIGGMTDSLLQACVLLAIGIALGVPFTASSAALTVLMLFALAIGLVSLGLIIGSFLDRPESFGLVSSFAVYPLFLLSGALYPLDKLPFWMRVLTRLDPASFAVDGLRHAIIGASTLSFSLDLAIVAGFDAVLIVAGTWAFNRMKL